MCGAAGKIFGGLFGGGHSSYPKTQTVVSTPAAVDVSNKENNTTAETEAARKRRARSGYQSTNLADLAGNGSGKSTLG